MDESTDRAPVAVLYQSGSAPPIDGVVKPLKPGGYRDSGADIAFALRERGVSVVTPAVEPRAAADLDWVFADDAAGITAALAAGAEVLWANTVLHAQHALGEVPLGGAEIVGQRLDDVDRFDDKWVANQLMHESGLPVARGLLLRVEAGRPPTRDALIERLTEVAIDQPVVIKPVRGRGSQGVRVAAELEAAVTTIAELTAAHDETSGAPLFGAAVTIEEFLPGEEITITVLPPGDYRIEDEARHEAAHWALPTVRRFNHEDGIAPYSGVVAVTANSEAIPAEETTPELEKIAAACAEAGRLLDTVAPIRIDCRADAGGRYKLFDINLKPNMTGPGRPGRDDRDSLTMIAARELGWHYGDLLTAILSNCR